jgi:hypothetical protein
MGGDLGRRGHGVLPAFTAKPIVRALAALALVVGLAFLSGGCAPGLKQLDKSKELWAQEDFQAIVAEEARCEPGAEGCNQLHLIRGDACYRVAKQGVDKERNFTCAVAELQEGMRQTTQWEFMGLDLNEPQTYENLCESLRNLQDLQKGKEARSTGARLLSTAEEFKQSYPEHLAAIYFVSKARFRTLQPALLHADDGNRGELCGRVGELAVEIEGAMSRARGSRYDVIYRQFETELAGVRDNILKCP